MKPTFVTRPPQTAGALLVLAGSAILMGIITAEALYPATYTTFDNEISDLGATRPPDSVILQPSATIFNVTMMVTGALILVAALLAARSLRRLLIVPLSLLGLGVLGVGVFPGNVESVHPLMALLAFTAGGCCGIAGWIALSGPARWLSLLLGVISLGHLGYVMVGGLDAPWVAALGDGGAERWVAYPVVLWLVMTGGWLLADERAS